MLGCKTIDRDRQEMELLATDVLSDEVWVVSSHLPEARVVDGMTEDQA